MDGQTEYFDMDVDDSAAPWLANDMDQRIEQLEALSGLTAVELWSQKLSGRQVWLYTDNEIAFRVLQKGWSPTPYLAQMAAHFWLTALTQNVCIWLDVVASKANIADGPSRREYLHVKPSWRRLQQPKVPQLREWSYWFQRPMADI